MIDLGTKTIETNRLVLRKFTIDDVEGMYTNWAVDVECSKMLAWNVHENRDITKEVISLWISKYNKPYNFNWVVELKEDGQIIGSISVIKSKQGMCEVGYCYGSKYWGNGYATEALKAVSGFLIEEVGFRLVEAAHISENPASGRVMQKAGMRKDAVLRQRRINKYTNNINDLIVYSITREEL
jgi:RimJ/RimL family protein N-acetyltransferase